MQNELSKNLKPVPNMCWLIGEIQIFDTQEKKVKIYYKSVIKLTYSYHSLPNLKIKYQTKSLLGYLG